MASPANTQSVFATRLERWLGAAEQTGRVLLGVLVIAMVLLNVASSAGRYLFGRSIPGADELLVFAMVWLVFLGAIFVTKDRSHLGFDLLRKASPPRLAILLTMATDIVILLIAVFVGYQSWQVVGRLAQIGQRSMAVGIPMAIPHSAIFIGFALTALITLFVVLRGAAALLKGGPSVDGGATP